MDEEWANELISTLHRSTIDVNGTEYPIIAAKIWEQYKGTAKQIEAVCRVGTSYSTLVISLNPLLDIPEIVENVQYTLANWIRYSLSLPEGQRSVRIQEQEDEKEEWQKAHDEIYGNQ